ncbi:leishmanolysin [Acrasis kona]|uniref:Leishmanolysin n=1 Tax=Acrasis kona TaxID=1008807 RepID=A0AAW2YNA5_9EUKA
MLALRYLIATAYLVTSLYCLRITFDTSKIMTDSMRTCTVSGGLYFRGPIGTSSITCESTTASSDYTGPPATTCSAICGDQDVVTRQIYNDFINNTLPALLNRVQSVIDIKDTLKKPTLNVPAVNCAFTSNTGINITTPFTLNNTDVLIYVFMRPMPRIVGTQGLYCYRDEESKRPVVGLLNVPVPVLRSTNLQSLLLKQVLHILGFHWPILSKEVYTFTQTTRIINNAQRVSTYLVPPPTSTALSTIQKHTGCSLITQIEMEDTAPAYNTYLYDGPNQFTSFLEKRAFNNEIMTNNFSLNLVNAVDGTQPALSNITLGIFADMPWYQVNFTNADRYVFGKSVGCALNTQQCENWVPAQSDATSRLYWYWCDNPSINTHCTLDLTSKGDCNVQQYDPAPIAYYRHFPNVAFGGSDIVNDYCPFVSPSFGGDCRVSVGSDADSQTGEFYGATSRCFMSNIRTNPQGSTQPAATSTCLNTACGPLSNSTSSDIYLFVQIGSTWYKCEKAGGKVSGLNGALGTLFCPPVDLVCTDGARSVNWDDSIAASSIHSQGNQVPWWAWLVLGLGLGIPLLILFLLIVGFFAWKEMKKRDKITVVDLRNPKKKARY